MTITGSRLVRLFVRYQFGIVSMTLLLGIFAYVVPAITGNDKYYGLIPLLDVGRESNLPTWISATNLLVAAAICFAFNYIRRWRADALARNWLILAWIFVYLSLDESAMIHEKFDNLRAIIPDESIVNSRHSWLFLGTAVAVFLMASMLPFLLRLPRKTAWNFVIAGTIFASGAIGMEFVGTLMINNGVQSDDAIYQARRLVEEGLEMYGIVIFNCVAFRELAGRLVGLEVRLSDNSILKKSAEDL